MKTLISKFFVHPLTVAYIALALLMGRFSFIFFHILFSLIHEFAHGLTATSLKLKVQEIVFLPIGFYARIENLDKAKVYKQLLILLAGPASYLISNMIIELLYDFNYLSVYGLRGAKEINLMIMVFNLLPIIPLDGGRILRALLTLVTDEYRVRVISIVVSCLTSIAIVYFGFKSGQYIIFFFVLLNIISEVFQFKRSYRRFLIERYNQIPPNKIKVLHRLAIYRHRENFCITSNSVINEKQIIKLCLSKRMNTKQRLHKRPKTEEKLPPLLND